MSEKIIFVEKTLTVLELQRRNFGFLFQYLQKVSGSNPRETETFANIKNKLVGHIAVDFFELVNAESSDKHFLVSYLNMKVLVFKFCFVVECNF